ncbi:phage portal protein [Parapedobacter indicus]|uniref:Phage portal protein, SPP1 family n=1 Tax=Parapedobacter indicus TaxID=1477437 RepID=A0A1I3V1H9_9SPHI|nr:phage portal protein [Parapedobacter indicus]PPK98992.1 SPP1 family phage portal protein [Parapedobacter indicus]SFJ89278.1 phage portal protein, SPP1 family [Parapedobacter indicus]
MEDELIALLTTGEIEKAKSKFSNKKEDVEKALSFYNIDKHKISKESDEKVILAADGSVKDTITNWGLPIAYQKKIVQQSAVFLVGVPVKLIQESEGTDKAFELLTKLWNEMRQDSKNLEAATCLYSETECAKKFVPYRDADADPTDMSKSNSVRCIVLAKSKKDDLYVLFDEFGGMKAFARGYEVKTGNGTLVPHFDVETADNYYFSKKDDEGKWVTEVKKNLTKKINISYYTQEKWDSYLVDKIIERREYLSSKRANNNDAMGDPILVLEGDVESLPDKKELVKVVQIQPGGSASYLYPQMAVDLIKEEREDLEKLINYITDTVDLSTDALKSMGQDSGKALIMKFFPAELKAIFNRIYFREMLQREISILKAFMTNVIDTSSEMRAQCEKLVVTIEFSTPLPDDVSEIIEQLSTSTGGKPTLSQEEAAHLNPLVKNGKVNWQKLQQESVTTLDE